MTKTADVLTFERNVAKALDDGQLRRNLRSAMTTLSQRRRALFADAEAFE